MVPQKNMDITNKLSKLKWACRRGMLELDVLLGNFLNEAYSDLSLEDKQLFVWLLESPDPVLLDWLMGHAESEDAGLVHITELIRRHAATRVRD